ncbi:MAG: MarR family winged helix-turn-helix transcriptional regulator [Gammaproteobacteria bacterium]
MTDDLNFAMLPELLGYNIRLAQVAVFRDFVNTLGSYEISPTQFGTLVIIQSNPGIKQSDLAKAMQLDRSSIVPLIDRLEKNGLVMRERLQDDRRTNALNITQEGNKLLKVLQPLVLKHEHRLVKNLTKTEQNQLITLLRKIFSG